MSLARELEIVEAAIKKLENDLIDVDQRILENAKSPEKRELWARRKETLKATIKEQENLLSEIRSQNRGIAYVSLAIIVLAYLVLQFGFDINVAEYLFGAQVSPVAQQQQQPVASYPLQ